MCCVGQRTLAAILAVFALLAQEPGVPAFHANSRLVLVPFHVQRGKFFAADMQPSDFILREDGRPREFTTFEGPNTAHPLPLELILLFDTTPRVTASKDGFPTPVWALDPKADYEFLPNWDESPTSALLQMNGIDIRIAIYHYSGRQLERLCEASQDPREIVHAFRSLLDPIPPGKGELTPLPGNYVFKPLFGPPHDGWMRESIAATLNDAAASPVPARRVLLVFTSGMSGTVSKSLDLYSGIVDPALALSVSIDPVIMAVYKQQLHVTASAPGPGGALSTVDPPKQSDPLSSKPGGMSPFAYSGLLPWFANVGEKTGGATFVPRRLDRDALAAILAQVRDTTLSQYVVGFTPDTAAKPKKHSLAVALRTKSGGKLIGGEKSGVEY